MVTKIIQRIEGAWQERIFEGVKKYEDPENAKKERLFKKIKAEIEKLQITHYRDEGDGKYTPILRDALNAPSIDEVVETIINLREGLIP